MSNIFCLHAKIIEIAEIPACWGTDISIDNYQAPQWLDRHLNSILCYFSFLKSRRVSSVINLNDCVNADCSRNDSRNVNPVKGVDICKNRQNK